MRRLADCDTTLPFLYQVMLGGGTASVSHSRVNDFPTRVFTTTGASPPLSLILGGTERDQNNIHLLPQGQALCVHTGVVDVLNTVRWMCR